MTFKPNQTLFDKTIKSDIIFFYQKALKYFNDLQNRYFSVLYLSQLKQWK